MNTLIQLGPLDLALACALVVGAIALSRLARLGLEGRFAIASARSIGQLLAAGYLLSFIFALESPWAVLLALGVMLTIAALVARNRISKKLENLLSWVWGSLFVSTAITLSYVVFLIVRPPVWYDPQYLIPLAGMIIGNAMDTATIAGERLVSTIRNSPLEIETHLSLGATPHQAVSRYYQESIRAGLIPLLNRMTVVGMVTLPGMLTGQVLSGTEPLEAALYQILILLAIAFANVVAVLLVTRGIVRQCFNQNAQFLLM
ncbi:MAG: iron export ABC transporter permease subunit FetB [Cyanobacteriota bacterium]|nr:iron export ABC transporter permease subunit FetB [Cyanobacteriota bacterium]